MSSDGAAASHYYVYYRLRPETERDDARAAIRAMQLALHKKVGVAGRLMERLGDDATWMEVYEAVPDARRFEAALAEAERAHGLAALIEPGAARHIERFIDCD